MNDNKNTTAAQPLDLDKLSGDIMNLPSNYKGDRNFEVAYKTGHHDARHAAAELVNEQAALIAQARAAQPAGAADTTVSASGSIEDYAQFHTLLGSWISMRDYYQYDGAPQVAEAWRKFIDYIDSRATQPVQAGEAVDREWIQRTWMECNQDLFVFTQAVQARATLAPVSAQQAAAKAPAAVPVGWKTIAVNPEFDTLMYWMDRASGNSNLPSDVAESWGVFEFVEVCRLAASPASTPDASQQAAAAPKHRDIFGICDAYESGIGHGLQRDGHRSGAVFGDPEHARAYEIGYEEGERRAIPGVAAKAPAAQAVDAREKFIAWANKNGFKTALRDDPASPDTFFYYETEQRWIVWQAASPASTPDASQQAAAVAAPRLPPNDEVFAEVNRQRDAVANNRYVSTNAVNDVMAAVRALCAVAETTSEDARDAALEEIFAAIDEAERMNSYNESLFQIGTRVARLKCLADDFRAMRAAQQEGE